MSLAIGDILTLDIGNIANGGHFVARHDNQIIFVRHAIFGETAKVKVTAINSRFAFGDAVDTPAICFNPVGPYTGFSLGGFVVGMAGVGPDCTAFDGFNEVVKLLFDPTEVSYTRLLAIFWENHDPTQKNRQGNDIGTQYRSGAYYFSEAQKGTIFQTKEIYEQSMRKAGFGSIATEIKDAPEFFLAEEYHQQYLAKNPNGYCGLGGCGVKFN